MPNTTGDYPMPYPNSGDAPDAPAAVLDLAQAIDNALTNDIQPQLDAVGLVHLQTIAGTGSEIIVDGLSLNYTGFLIEIASRGSAASITAVLRTAAPADLSGTGSSGYDRTELLGRNGVASSSTNAGQTQWTIAGLSNTRQIHRLNVEGLCQAVETLILHDGATHADPAVQNAANGRYAALLSHQEATIYRGLRFILSASQTYVCRVYGKR